MGHHAPFSEALRTGWNVGMDGFIVYWTYLIFGGGGGGLILGGGD